MNRMAIVLKALLVACLFWSATAHAEDQLNINTATEQDLERLPGVGSGLARKIVEERDRNGPFASLDDLTRVRGLSATTVDKIRDFVFVGGSAGRGRGGGEVADARRDDAGARDVRKLLSRYANEPSIRDVQEAATRFAEVRPEMIASWQSRSRVAALGPQLRAEYRYVGSTDARLAETSTGQTQTDNTGIEHRPLARAQWDLDRLIFNPDELRVSNQVVDLVRLRESVLDQVNKLYFERRRLQIDLEVSPPTDVAGRVRKELRLQELVADLDALTGGFFSRKLAERGLE
jgi:competence ComEA-like helix-hairpin-helix protein